MKCITKIVVFFMMFPLISNAQFSAREYFKFAKAKFDEGKLDESLDYLNQALSLDESYSNAFFLRAEVHYHKKMYYNCISDLTSGFNLDGSPSSYHGRFYSLRALAYDKLGKDKEAEEDFKTATDVAPSSADIFYYKSQYFFNRKNYEESMEAIEKAIEKDNSKAEYYVHRAITNATFIEVASGDDTYKSIVEDFKRALALKPDDVSIYEKRSQFYMQLNHEDKALADFNKVIELNPVEYVAFTERGVIKLHQHNYEEAMIDFTKSIEINPNEEKNYRMRALCLHNVRDFDKAYADFSNSIELLKKELLVASDRVKVERIMAEAYLMRGTTLEAMGEVMDACDDFAASYDLGFKRAMNYYKKYCVY